MGDIPDWLVELAAQQGQDDEEDETEWDFLRAEPSEAPLPVPDVGSDLLSDSSAASQAPSPDEELVEGDLMAALRSQVELEEPEELPVAAAAKHHLDFRVAGMLPWQQFVLAILLFLDVAVIGLLFLVMLGRVGIP